MTADLNGLNRLRQGRRPSDVDDVVDTLTAGPFVRKATPFRLLAIVNDMIRAKRAQPRELVR